MFVVLSLDLRPIECLNVTYYPSAEWIARQLYQAFPFESAPKDLVRDRNGIYGNEVVEALNNLGIEEKVIVFGRRHAKRMLNGYLEYYHGSRTHLGLDKDAPDGRAVEPAELGPVRREAMVGELHGRYYRDAA